MHKQGPIIVIEDDADDRDLLKLVFKDLRCTNEVLFFIDGDSALQHLRAKDTHPFIILSDVNLPRLNGFELKKIVHTSEGLSEKCIPYVFYSTSADKKAIYEAYAMSVQGYFLKPTDYAKLTHTIKVILDYWTECYSPNDFDH